MEPKVITLRQRANRPLLESITLRAREAKQSDFTGQVRPTRPQAPRRSPAQAAPREDSPARAFEKAFAPIFLPPSVAKQRPDLVQLKADKAAAAVRARKNGQTLARAFEDTFAPVFIPPAIAKKRPDLVERVASAKREAARKVDAANAKAADSRRRRRKP